MLAMGRQRIKLSEQIRHAVAASGLSRYRIANELGIAESTMSRFMSGRGGLSMKYLDALADLLDLDIKTGQQRRSRKGR
jgi:transcriptional regulator with XRE-family HTH domain